MVLVKAKRDEILGPLSAVSGIIERRHTLPILSNVLIDRVGMENVNRMLDSLNLPHTRLRRKMMDIKAAAEGRENISTPREMLSLLEQIYRGKVLNQETTQEFLKMLSTHKDSWLPRDLPDSVRVADKPGSVSGGSSLAT